MHPHPLAATFAAGRLRLNANPAVAALAMRHTLPHTLCNGLRCNFLGARFLSIRAPLVGNWKLPMQSPTSQKILPPRATRAAAGLELVGTLAPGTDHENTQPRESRAGSSRGDDDSDHR